MIKKFVDFEFGSNLSFAGNNSDLLEKIEGLVAIWTKQIEQVLAESEQVLFMYCH